MIPLYMANHLFDKHPLLGALERNELPPHTYVELDRRGEYPSQPQSQLHVLEAMLFEDMCSAWNESCAVEHSTSNPYATKTQLKRLAALHRAAVSSAFYMVEAYCNGIAFEVSLTRRGELTQRELEMITEWDRIRSRPKYLSVRDKILHYPRLLAGASSPLVQENNSPALAFFLTSAKELRDSIVHASPAWTPDTMESDKVRRFVRIDHNYCGRIVDSAVSVVHEVANALRPERAVSWLQRRKADGTFDPSVFD